MIWAALALAGEHDDISAPAPPEAPAAQVPAGAPRAIMISPGEPLQAIVSDLPPGSTATLRSGRHIGPLVVDRALTLQGEPGAVLDGSGLGSVLIISADNSVVRDLRVTGGGHLPQQDDSGVVVSGDRVSLERIRVDHAYIGIDLRMASGGTVKDCRVEGDPGDPFGLRGDGIRLWESDGNTIVGNTLSHVRDLVVWYSNGNTFRANTVERSRYGTHLMHADGNLIEGNRYDHDVVGVFIMYSSDVTLRDNTVIGSHGEAGVGIGLKESDQIVAENNVLVDGTTGIYLDTTPHRKDGLARFERNLLAANDIGIRFHGPSTGALFTGNSLVSNRIPASSDERGRTSNARFEGNYWSEYAGYDLDGDGTGDLAFELRSASGSLIDRYPDLAWLVGSPALALVDLFVAAFPMFAPQSVVRDPSPEMADRRTP